jgi:hypothetical protein
MKGRNVKEENDQAMVVANRLADFGIGRIRHADINWFAVFGNLGLADVEIIYGGEFLGMAVLGELKITEIQIFDPVAVYVCHQRVHLHEA